uniref:Uncharacterized protein n=1 Tax=Callorhinchus milii TaxID=7868 RepID=A0A4W3HJG8_CALMI
FLTLAANKIQKVENLQRLCSLGFLDLSDNRIQELDPGEFPASLVILKLTGNDCTKREGYQELVTKALPGLRRLDGHFIDNNQDMYSVCEEEGEGEEDEGEELASGEEDQTEDQEDDLLLEFPYSSQSIKGQLLPSCEVYTALS